MVYIQSWLGFVIICTIEYQSAPLYPLQQLLQKGEPLKLNVCSKWQSSALQKVKTLLMV